MAYQAYDLQGTLALEPLGNGLINKTYRIQQGDGQGWQRGYVLKKSISLSFRMFRPYAEYLGRDELHEGYYQSLRVATRANLDGCA